MTDEMNFSDVAGILSRNKQRIFLFSLAITVLAAVTVFLLPKQYLATVTLIPANPSIADKTMIFSEGRMQAVPTLGTAEDLDRIYATAILDEVFRKVTDSLDLVTHYGIHEPGDTATSYAMDKLKDKQSKIYKTENGEVKIKIWDTGRKTAADIANALAFFVQVKSQEIINKSNNSILLRLQKTVTEKENELNAAGPAGSNSPALQNEITGLRKMILQYQLTISNNAESAVITEAAYPPAIEDKPKKLFIILLAFFSSLLFAVFLSLLVKRSKS